MREARACKALASFELSVLSVPGVFENVASLLSAAHALRLSATCKALLSLPLPREHAFTVALWARQLDVGSTTRAHRPFLFLSSAILGLRWLLRVLLLPLGALRRAPVRAVGKDDGCGSCEVCGTLERCVRSLVSPTTGALSLDGCDSPYSAYVLARLCAGTAPRIRSLDVRGACPPLLRFGDRDDNEDQHSDGYDDDDQSDDGALTSEDLVSATSGCAWWPQLGVGALSRRRRHDDAERAALSAAMRQATAVTVRPTLASAPLQCDRAFESALAARFRRNAAAAAADPTSVWMAARPAERRLALLETLVAWAPGDARCVPFTPPQARELAAACAGLPVFRAAHVIIFSLDASQPGHSVRDGLDATAALPPASRVALYLHDVGDGAARDVAAALDGDAAGRIAWVWIHLPPGAEPRRVLRAATRRREAAGRPVHLEALR